MINSKNLKKTIAILCSILLAVNLFSALAVFAETPSTVLSYSGSCDNESYPLSQTNNYPDYKLLTSETNILVNKPLEVKAYDENGSIDHIVLGSTDSFTDGYAKDANAGIEYGGHMEGRYLDLTFTLNGAATIKNLVLFNCRDTSLATAEYSVYAAESLEALDSANALITYKNTDGNECQIFDFEGIENVRYFRLRVLKSGNDTYARFYEIALYASSFTEDNEIKMIYSGTLNGDSEFTLATDWPDYQLKTTKENILTGKPLVLNAANESGSINPIVLGSTDSFTDGYAKDAGAGIEYGGNIEGNYLDLTYNLGGVAKIDYISVFNHNQPNLATKKYEIYLASSKEELETVEPVITCENPKGDMCQVFSISGVEDTRYFRLRVLNSGDDTYARFLEIAAYASGYTEEADASLVYTGTLNGANPFSQSTDWPDYKLTTTETNILSGKPVGFASYDATGYKESGFEPVSPSTLTDGYAKDRGEGYYVGGDAGSRYFDITYTLCGAATPKNIAIINADGDLATKKYALYAADSAENLENSEPLITFENTDGDKVQVFSVSGLYDVKYFRIRVLIPNNYNGDNCVRFRELAMYGEYTPDNVTVAYSGDLNNSDYPITATTDNILNASENNILQNKKVTITKDDGATVIPDPGIDAATITDGSVNNAFYIGDGGAYTDLTYELNGSVIPESMLIVNANDKKLRTYRYAVYMADSLEALDAARPMITVTNYGDQYCQVINFENAGSAKYVRIRLIDSSVVRDGLFRINEILLTGDYTESSLVEFTDYTVENGYITRVALGTSSESFDSHIVKNGDVSVAYEGLTADNTVKTGTVVKVSKDGVSEEYTVVVAGDLNSDGILNVIDLIYAKKYILNNDILTDNAQILALDCDFDGNKNASDIVVIRKMILTF